MTERSYASLITVLLHVAAVWALLQLDVVRKPLLEAVPLMVHLITPPKPEPTPPTPEVVPPKPLPVARQPVAQPAIAPLLAAESSAPGASAIAPQPKPVAIAPAPQASARIEPPSFNAAYLRNPPPAYPAIARRRGEQGTVVLRVYVSGDGSAEKVLVHATSGHERLDQAAHDAVHQWRFVPARQGDQAIAAWVLVPIKFALEN